MPAREPIIDLINKKFNMFTVLADAQSDSPYRVVVAQCRCGTIKTVRLAELKNGKSTNCGCIRSAKLRLRNAKHSLSRHPLYRIWRGMIERCYYDKHVAYNRYGERGIKVCDEWQNDFMTFYNWAIANGWRKKLEIDRKNNDGNYCPENCRIVTQLINARNKSSNRMLTFDGRTMCMSEWSEIVGIAANTIKDRLNKLGWTIDEALTTPLQIKNKCS